MDETTTLTEVDGHRLVLSNLSKVLYSSTGFTKAEVIDYYLRIAPVLLPHITDRPLTRLRLPDGVGNTTFYEKNAPVGTPDWVRVVPVDGSEGRIDYVVADNAATLVWLANVAALELHVPQWRFPADARSADTPQLREDWPRDPGWRPDHDRLVIDLDPGEGITMIDLARAAVLAGGRLAGDGLIPVCRTSGGKGLQIAAAIAPTDGRIARNYVRSLAAELVRATPQLFVDQMSKQVRQGRIFIDYNQNQTSRNTIAPYSLRGRDEPWVATPVSWDEVAEVDHPNALRFSSDQVLERVTERGDLAADALISDPPSLPSKR